MKRILVIDDDSNLRWVFQKSLEHASYEVDTAANGKEGMELQRRHPYPLIFLDIRLPDYSGLQVIQDLRSASPSTRIIVMTAQDTMQNAIEAMRAGAFDYIAKPFDLDEIEVLATKAFENWRLVEEVQELRSKLSEKKEEMPILIGKSPAIKTVFKMIGKVAASDITVLIEGESGTGKELVARAIHYYSSRKEGPFVAINMAAIPNNLLESELFGHERGAFTGAIQRKEGRFEQASGGTLFLDEIGEMPFELQGKLLRALEQKCVEPLGGEASIPVDVRVISATNADLEQLIQKNRFRSDLFYRLNVISMKLPPLRERKEDLPELVRFFIEKYQKELGASPKEIPSEAMDPLLEYPWPGNIRELENAIKRALILSTDSQLTVQDFPQLKKASTSGENRFENQIREEIENRLCAEWNNKENLYREAVEQIERPLIEAVLKKTHGNQLKAARLLGINRNTLRKKIEELRLKEE
ncbi:MAG: sigma-54-dependent Fis family transcriptional regulator [Deltaproteobacteria bacterium]|nr:sigma-54-dependent Fis family transcriptional regulator [Deltaproteobacteria bacterium]